jgi:hypothetical protein
MGRRPCLEEGCAKQVAYGGTQHCVGHGGGRRCQHVGCTKSADANDTLHCKAHGGGKRCQEVDCTKSAQGGTSHCVAHGGGKRCQLAGCTKSAQGGMLYCIAHGGGKACEMPGCPAHQSIRLALLPGARRRQALPHRAGVRWHGPLLGTRGGGKRCTGVGAAGGICKRRPVARTELCKKHAEREPEEPIEGIIQDQIALRAPCTWTVQALGTCYPERVSERWPPPAAEAGLHGGGRRCQEEGCIKAAVTGGTPFCQAHGGGRRCQQEGCSKPVARAPGCVLHALSTERAARRRSYGNRGLVTPGTPSQATRREGAAS